MCLVWALIIMVVQILSLNITTSVLKYLTTFRLEMLVICNVNFDYIYLIEFIMVFNSRVV